MAGLQWFEAVKAAFPDNPELCQRILAEGQHEPTRLPRLFEDISRDVLAVKAGQASQEVPINSKKRKLEDGLSQPNGASAGIANATTTFECNDVSFQIPARKKLKLQLVADSKETRKREIRLLHPTTNDIEYALPAENIDQAFCLPVPEKQQRQMNFAIFPKPGATSADGVPAEQVLFTMNEAPPATVTSEDAVGETDTYVSVTQLALAKLLAPSGKRVIISSEKEFASSIPQSHRKGEKAYHVKAHRGSKEGYLFLLENGIVFGFKKPLAFFPFSAIESISYTSVLQRTFNLVIAAYDPSPTTSASPSEIGEAKEIEFSMLDQEDFAGIDAYVKRHGLNDASMAAQRRAKAYNVNKEKKVDINGETDAGGSVEDGQSELQKAEQLLQDEEDEEEEDYELSGGESDGEGEESEASEEGEEDGEGYEEEEGEFDEEVDEDGVEGTEHEE